MCWWSGHLHVKSPEGRGRRGSAGIAYLLYQAEMPWDIQYYDEKLQTAVLALPPGILARYIFTLSTGWLSSARTSGCLIPGQWAPDCSSCA